MTTDRDSRQRRLRLGGFLPWVALTILLVVPLYAVSAAFAIRSGVFDLKDKQISPDEYKALWAFIASGLATTATIVGLLFTRAHNRRALAVQEDIEARKLAYQTEADKRLTLDTAVRGLELIATGAEYAPPAKIAGALAALVHLGHPVIAVRTLDAAWDDNAIDAGTACWLISGIYREGSEESVREAARLLRTHAKDLSAGDSQKGRFDWPSALHDSWPVNMPRDARVDNLVSAIDLLLSRSRSWWGHDDAWIFILLNLVMRYDADVELKRSAARVLEILLESGGLSSGYIVSDDEQITAGDLHKRVEEIVSLKPAGLVADINIRLEKIRRWAENAEKDPSPSD